MDLDELQTNIHNEIVGIPQGQVSKDDCEKYAITFNRMKIFLAEIERNLRNNKADLNLALKVAKAHAFQNAFGSNLPERKLNAETDTEVLETVQMIEKTNSDLKYIETSLKICEDYHTHFRKYCG